MGRKQVLRLRLRMTIRGVYGVAGDWKLFPWLGLHLFGGEEGVEEAVVLFFGERAVDVVGRAFVPAGGEVDLVHVDGGGVDDGRDAVVEGEVLGAGEALELGGEGRAGERAGGKDGNGVRIVLVECGDLFALDFDAWLLRELLGDAAGELDAVDGEGMAGGDGGGVGCGEEEAVGATHLLFEQPGRGVFGFGLEGVGADQLGEVGCLVRLGGAERAHLGEGDLAVGTRCEGGGLQSGFRTGESAADDVNILHVSSGYEMACLSAELAESRSSLRSG